MGVGGRGFTPPLKNHINIEVLSNAGQADNRPLDPPSPQEKTTTKLPGIALVVELDHEPSLML